VIYLYSWHVSQTVVECDERLSADGFYVFDGGLYCTRDYQTQFGVKCRYCDQFITGEVVTVLQYTYHDVCFCCSVCRPVIVPTHSAINASNSSC